MAKAEPPRTTALADAWATISVSGKTASQTSLHIGLAEHSFSKLGFAIGFQSFWNKKWLADRRPGHDAIVAVS